MTWLDGWRALWRVVWLLLTYDPEGEEVQAMEAKPDMLQFRSGHTRRKDTGLFYKEVGGLFFVCVVPRIGPISYHVFSSEKALYDYVKSYAPQAA